MFHSVIDPSDALRVYYVILGTTGSGTGKIGACGGINNPTHYVRLTKLRWFIDRYVEPRKGSKDVCYVKANKKVVYQVRLQHC